MSDNFIYEKPDERAFFKGLMAYLKSNDKVEIINLIKYSKCKIKTTTNFSRVRWNAYAAEIYFYVPINDLESIKIDKYLKLELRRYCSKIMPEEYGYDIINIEFLPLMIDGSNEGLINDLEDIIQTLPQEIKNQMLPEDIKQKGKKMAQTYLYLYCIENSLRLFIEKLAKEKFGNDYFSKIQVKGKIKEQIKSRKEDEDKNKWLSLRGESEIFYLDFKDLESIIRNNKDIFGSYFPDDHWLSVKIKEMAKIRDRIAHNSFIDNHEISVLKNNYESILRQISDKERKLGII